MGDNESQGVNGLLHARIKELEIEVADLQERNQRLEARDRQRGGSAIRIQDEFRLEPEGDVWRVTCRRCGVNYATSPREQPEGALAQGWMREHHGKHEQAEEWPPKPQPPPVRVIRENEKPKPPSDDGSWQGLTKRLALCKRQVGIYCADFCHDSAKGLPPCCSCPLGKL